MADLHFKSVTRTQGNNRALKDGSVKPKNFTFDFVEVDLRGLGAINKNAWLAIRPEQVVLSFGASFPEDNLLKGTIANIRFSGPSTYVTLDCSGISLEAMVTRLIGLNIGDECMVGLPPDRIRVLAD